MMTTAPKVNHLMNETEGPLLCYFCTTPVTETEYRDFLERVQANIKAYGEFRLLLLYENFMGWEKEAAELDVSFYVDYGKFFKKFALVGAPDKEIMSKMISCQMISSELKIFSKDHLQEALSWIKA